MELSILFIATLIITVLSNILIPCLSQSDTSSTQHRLTKQVLTSSHDQQPAETCFTKPPRKLLSADETTNVSNDAGKKPKTEMSEDAKKIQGTFSVKRPRNHAIMEGRKGTRQTWVESKAYQYFTMDYTEVRRSRPVHNKFMPLQQ